MTLARGHEYRAALIERSRLTKAGSTKDVWHIVLTIESAHFTYEVGDSLGVYAENNVKDVEALFHFFQLPSNGKGFDPKVKEEISLFSLLLKRFDLSKVPLKLVRLVEQTTSETRRAKLKAFVEQHFVRGALCVPIISFLKAFATKELPFDSFYQSLLPLLPRYYSIASSPKQMPQKAELTVALVSHYVLEETRYGLCSHFLTERAPLHTPSLKVSVLEAGHFRLPQDKEAPLIMIGPGTGVAPFRAFLQELQQTRAVFPPCWLFFGDRHQKCDFLYEDFFSGLHKSGTLLLDLAFSRDLQEKLYVQHKMWEQRQKLASWIDGKGAYLYVAGDAASMARDVEKTLLDILVDQQVVSNLEDARAYLRNMYHAKRYCRDVY